MLMELHGIRCRIRPFSDCSAQRRSGRGRGCGDRSGGEGGGGGRGCGQGGATQPEGRLASVLVDLERHFRTEGTPVMVGGSHGRAITLLGVRRRSQEVCVLDPHHTTLGASLGASAAATRGNGHGRTTGVRQATAAVYRWEPAARELGQQWFNLCMPLTTAAPPSAPKLTSGVAGGASDGRQPGSADGGARSCSPSAVRAAGSAAASASLLVARRPLQSDVRDAKRQGRGEQQEGVRSVAAAGHCFGIEVVASGFGAGAAAEGPEGSSD